MQYGNGRYKIEAMTDARQFKSYYVVWKRHVMTGQRCESAWFKSYYVVWKLANLGRIIPIAIGFKSYYVVWKQKQASHDSRSVSSLNRTMQYGNKSVETSTQVGSEGLNRTMQYGNNIVILHRASGKGCLNRTMQYGNEDIQELISDSENV